MVSDDKQFTSKANERYDVNLILHLLVILHVPLHSLHVVLSFE